MCAHNKYWIERTTSCHFFTKCHQPFEESHIPTYLFDLEKCFQNWGGLIFMVSFISSDFNTLSISSLGIPEPSEKKIEETFSLGLSGPMCLTLYLMSGWGSLYLLRSAVWGSFYDGGWPQHWSASMANVLRCHFLMMFSLYTLAVCVSWVLSTSFL